MRREVRQGCPLSPLLFNVMLVEVMARGRWGGVKLRERKIYLLAYADDMALVAEDEEGIKAKSKVGEISG